MLDPTPVDWIIKTFPTVLPLGTSDSRPESLDNYSRSDVYMRNGAVSRSHIFRNSSLSLGSRAQEDLHAFCSFFPLYREAIFEAYFRFSGSVQ